MRKIIALFFIVGISLSSAHSSQSSWPLKPELLSEYLEQFNKELVVDAENAFEKRSLTRAQKKNGKKIADTLEGGWNFFVNTSVTGVVYAGTYDAIVMHYNPYADCALLTVWNLSDKGVAVIDAELVLGECIRKSQSKEFEIIPLWRRSKMPPVYALAIEVKLTIDSFHKAFSILKSAENWRYALPALTDKKLIKANQKSASQAMQNNFESLKIFNSEPSFKNAKTSALNLIELLITRNYSKAFAIAKNTDKAVKEAIIKGKIKSLSATSFANSQNGAFLFLGETGRPNFFMTVFFNKQNNMLQLERIDVINHQLFSKLKR